MLQVKEVLRQRRQKQRERALSTPCTNTQKINDDAHDDEHDHRHDYGDEQHHDDYDDTHDDGHHDDDHDYDHDDDHGDDHDDDHDADHDDDHDDERQRLLPRPLQQVYLRESVLGEKWSWKNEAIFLNLYIFRIVLKLL